jgi:predicted NUDIX family NTP pyrophosphohydrolase
LAVLCASGSWGRISTANWWISERSGKRAGKIVHGYAGRGEFDVSAIKGEMIEIEWPPRSGRTTRFPEVDRAAWFSAALARTKLVPTQAAFVDRLEALLAEA